jgi:hypothetical protein
VKRSTKRWAAAVTLGAAAVALLGTKILSATAAAQLQLSTGTLSAQQPANQLTDEETKAGWKLLFDGKTLNGWHNFKREGVRPGWKVQDGALACADPHDAGDIVTADKYDWFELSIEYTISEAGNSGILFHVTDEGRATWATGPEIQLEDNQKARDTQRCGWLYKLYKPENDPKTGQPIDATKPVGEWNHVRVVIAPPPAKSEVAVNGVKYYDFVWNSDDFKARIAKSKFRSMPAFAKSDTGYIALQGDHGSVSFRNVKLRPIPAGNAAP